MPALRFLAATLCALLLVPADAAPAKPQVPGYVRYVLGDFTVTALNDGALDIDLSGLHGMPAEKVRAVFERSGLLRGNSVPTSVNAYLVDTGTHRVLVDGGTAKCFGDNPNLGQVVDNLKASGYAPEDIDTVVITHFHGDHYCELATADGKRVFPNATVWAAEEEAAYWLSETVANAQPENRRGGFKQARDTIGLYQAAGAFRTFKGEQAILPGLTAVPTPGHTPGHTSYRFESKGEKLLVLGDIVHAHAVQFDHPGISMRFDVDEKQAVAIRKPLFARLAKETALIAGAHLPFPGVGHIRKEGAAYAWEPLVFDPLRR